MSTTSRIARRRVRRRRRQRRRVARIRLPVVHRDHRPGLRGDLRDPIPVECRQAVYQIHPVRHGGPGEADRRRRHRRASGAGVLAYVRNRRQPECRRGPVPGRRHRLSQGVGVHRGISRAVPLLGRDRGEPHGGEERRRMACAGGPRGAHVRERHIRPVRRRRGAERVTGPAYAPVPGREDDFVRHRTVVVRRVRVESVVDVVEVAVAHVRDVARPVVLTVVVRRLVVVIRHRVPVQVLYIVQVPSVHHGAHRRGEIRRVVAGVPRVRRVHRLGVQRIGRRVPGRPAGKLIESEVVDRPVPFGRLPVRAGVRTRAEDRPVHLGDHLSRVVLGLPQLLRRVPHQRRRSPVERHRQHRAVVAFRPRSPMPKAAPCPPDRPNRTRRSDSSMNESDIAHPSPTHEACACVDAVCPSTLCES